MRIKKYRKDYRFKALKFDRRRGILPSLTVAEIKNRCIPCVYWGTAIFVVVMKYSNLFFSFAFFLDRSHFAFGYELIISSEAAGFMKIICNGFTLI